jgi:hypothetical protein
MMNIQMNGIDKLQQRLQNVISPQKTENTLDQAAYLIEADAKRLVRVDTGMLRASIGIIKQPNTRYIGSGKTYAAAQEFGRPDLRGYGYTPYLRPAARKNKKKIEMLFKKEIEK